MKLDRGSPSSKSAKPAFSASGKKQAAGIGRAAVPQSIQVRIRRLGRAGARPLMNYLVQALKKKRGLESKVSSLKWDEGRCQWDQSRMSFYCSSSPPRARLFLPRLQSPTCVVRTGRPSFVPAMDGGGWFNADRNAGAARARSMLVVCLSVCALPLLFCTCSESELNFRCGMIQWSRKATRRLHSATPLRDAMTGALAPARA